MTTDYKRIEQIRNAAVERFDDEHNATFFGFTEGAQWADKNPAPSLNDPYIEPCLNALTKTILKSDEMAQLLIKPYLEALDKLGLIIKSRDEEIVKLNSQLNSVREYLSNAKIWGQK